MITQLNNEQVNRYKRHLILPEVGMEGQKKLLNAKVLCIGAGGLGCPISFISRPPASERSAWRTSMSSAHQICSGRSSSASARSATTKSKPPPNV